MTETIATFQPSFMQKLLGRNYKWWYLIVISVKSDTTYFSQNIFYVFSTIIKNLLFIIVWYINLLSGSTILSLQEIVHYFIVGALVSSILFTDNVTWFLANQIQTGSLSSILLRPTSFFKWIFFNDLGRGFLQMLIQLSFTLVLLGLANYFLPIALQPLSILGFLLMLIISRFIQFLINFLQGLTAFWFTEIWGLTSTVGNFWNLSSGEMFPLDILVKFFPIFIFTFFLPFPFLFYYPTQIYLGKYTSLETLYVFLGGITWCLVLYFLAKWVFKMGLKQNESVGL